MGCLWNDPYFVEFECCVRTILPFSAIEYLLYIVGVTKNNPKFVLWLLKSFR